MREIAGTTTRVPTLPRVVPPPEPVQLFKSRPLAPGPATSGQMAMRTLGVGLPVLFGGLALADMLMSNAKADEQERKQAEYDHRLKTGQEAVNRWLETHSEYGQELGLLGPMMQEASLGHEEYAAAVASSLINAITGLNESEWAEYLASQNVAPGSDEWVRAMKMRANANVTDQLVSNPISLDDVHPDVPSVLPGDWSDIEREEEEILADVFQHDVEMVPLLEREQPAEALGDWLADNVQHLPISDKIKAILSKPPRNMRTAIVAANQPAIERVVAEAVVNPRVPVSVREQAWALLTALGLSTFAVDTIMRLTETLMQSGGGGGGGGAPLPPQGERIYQGLGDSALSSAAGATCSGSGGGIKIINIQTVGKRTFTDLLGEEERPPRTGDNKMRNALAYAAEGNDAPRSGENKLRNKLMHALNGNTKPTAQVALNTYLTYNDPVIDILPNELDWAVPSMPDIDVVGEQRKTGASCYGTSDICSTLLMNAGGTRNVFVPNALANIIRTSFTPLERGVNTYLASGYSTDVVRAVEQGGDQNSVLRQSSTTLNAATSIRFMRAITEMTTGGYTPGSTLTGLKLALYQLNAGGYGANESIANANQFVRITNGVYDGPPWSLYNGNVAGANAQNVLLRMVTAGQVMPLIDGTVAINAPVGVVVTSTVYVPVTTADATNGDVNLAWIVGHLPYPFKTITYQGIHSSTAGDVATTSITTASMAVRTGGSYPGAAGAGAPQNALRVVLVFTDIMSQPDSAPAELSVIPQIRIGNVVINPATLHGNDEPIGGLIEAYTPTVSSFAASCASAYRRWAITAHKDEERAIIAMMSDLAYVHWQPHYASESIDAPLVNSQANMVGAGGAHVPGMAITVTEPTALDLSMRLTRASGTTMRVLAVPPTGPSDYIVRQEPDNRPILYLAARCRMINPTSPANPFINFKAALSDLYRNNVRIGVMTDLLAQYERVPAIAFNGGCSSVSKAATAVAKFKMSADSYWKANTSRMSFPTYACLSLITAAVVGLVGNEPLVRADASCHMFAKTLSGWKRMIENRAFTQVNGVYTSVPLKAEELSNDTRLSTLALNAIADVSLLTSTNYATWGLQDQVDGLAVRATVPEYVLRRLANSRRRYPALEVGWVTQFVPAPLVVFEMSWKPNAAGAMGFASLTTRQWAEARGQRPLLSRYAVNSTGLPDPNVEHEDNFFIDSAPSLVAQGDFASAPAPGPVM